MSEDLTPISDSEPTSEHRAPFWQGNPAQYGLIALAIALVIASLWLPPVSLGNRLFHWDVPRITAADGGSVVHVSGARLDVAPGVLEDDTRVLIEALDASGTAGVVTSESIVTQAQGAVVALPDDESAQAALSNLPEGATLYSPFYSVSTFSDPPAVATLSVPLPYEIENTAMADLYAWDGQSWRWLPAQVTPDGLMMQSAGASFPAMFAVGTPVESEPVVGVVVRSGVAADCELPGLITVDGWTLDASGGVTGTAPTPDAFAAGGTQVIVSISNLQDGVIRSDLVDNLLIDDDAIASHAEAIAARVQSEGYDGVELAYLDAHPDLSGDLIALLRALDTALAPDKVLAVRVPFPQRTADGWDTGGYDWQSIGNVADLVRIPLPADPAAYGAEGDVDPMLAWAVGQIQRSRIQLVASAYSHDTTAGSSEPISYETALSLLTDNIQVENPAELLLPGQTLRLGTDPDNQRTLELDPESQVGWFQYRDASGEQHTVWMETARSLVRKLQAVNRYGLGGALIDGAMDKGNDGSILPLVATWQQDEIPPAPEYTMLWQVVDTEGNLIREAVTSLEDAKFAWVAPHRPGDYEVRAAISDDGGVTNRGIVAEVDVQVPTPTYTPTPKPTNTPRPTATPEPTATAAPAPTPEGGEAQAAPTPAPTAAPATGAPAAGRVGGYFGYGIQAHIYGGDAQIFGLIQGMGFNWIKQQVEWKLVEPSKGNYQWGDLDRIVGGAHASGLNVLLSVVKAPAWARGGGADLSVEGPPANPQDFADFLAALATRYRGRVQAYEVWNEQNLHYEWGNEPISASRYVELLRASFIALKNADPSAVVVSGAPTPTGMNDGVIAIDDRAYLEQMYQAGLARYCDAVGVHPSGYNNPPDADWRSWSDPSAPTFKGHPSFFFRGTMESYRNIMVAYGDGGKRLWPTEFGWSTFENLGASAPAGYEYANHNTEAEQAAWLVTAFQMARNWGWVGPMFVWNLNFAPVSGPANEKAGFGILRADWSPRPSYSALQAMPK